MVKQTITAILLLFASTQFVLIFGRTSLTVDYAQFDFAVRLIQETARSGRSVILSPTSISTALFTIYLAANGETKQRLQKILGGNAGEIEIQQYFAKLLADVVGIKNNKHILNIANRFYVREGFSIKPSFPDILQSYYGEILQNFNYEQRNDLAKELNSLVSSNTDKKITEMMTTTNVDLETKVLVLNGIYFKGTWKEQFTWGAKSKFDISRRETKEVMMMQLRAKLPYYENLSLQLVKLPYIGDELEMVIILPKMRFDLMNIREKMKGEDLFNYIRKAYPTEVEVKLPKFKLKEELNLEHALRRIGIMNFISENSNLRELSDEPVSISNVIHDASFEVDKEGTGTTAQTEFDYFDISIKYFQRFNADQPFLFFVVKNLQKEKQEENEKSDIGHQTILYAGQCGSFCSF
ncbi:unnamed protein product [Onchocerca ochengi]|uniref:SERPIN domain-containing protein n=1 Tax=Onchocerca ochengi TaxID=42157 RepID=A0A182EJ15_ONCOC|nr:unnamed protein product [Onchocerca ochengi]